MYKIQGGKYFDIRFPGPVENFKLYMEFDNFKAGNLVSSADSGGIMIRWENPSDSRLTIGYYYSGSYRLTYINLPKNKSTLQLDYINGKCTLIINDTKVLDNVSMQPSTTIKRLIIGGEPEYDGTSVNIDYNGYYDLTYVNLEYNNEVCFNASNTAPYIIKAPLTINNSKTLPEFIQTALFAVKSGNTLISFNETTSETVILDSTEDIVTKGASTDSIPKIVKNIDAYSLIKL